MASFGENLRREREMRGVSLEEISTATKISVRFLNSLEVEDFAKLPGGIFTRGFIRAYAKYLGLDEERVLAEYQMVAQPRSDVDFSHFAASQSGERRDGSRTPFIAVLFAVALLAGGYALYLYSRRTMEPSVPAASTSPAAATPGSAEPSANPEPIPSDKAPTTPEGSPAAASELPGSAVPGRAPDAGFVARSTTVTPTEEGLVLQVAATERAWVAVEGDGKTLLQRVMAPNEIQTLKAKESFDVTTGNAQALILTLNGETLKPLGRRGEVKSVRLTQKDLKRTSP